MPPTYSKIYDSPGEFRSQKHHKPKQRGEEIEFHLPYISPTMSYQRHSVQGFLKKYVDTVKFFQKSLKYKRYFTLDHNAKKMRIHRSNDPQSEYKLFEYKDILGMNLSVPNLDQKMAIQERWSFKFTLVTQRRLYVLFAASMDERNLWIHTFTWILAKNRFLMEGSALHCNISPKADELAVTADNIIGIPPKPEPSKVAGPNEEDAKKE